MQYFRTAVGACIFLPGLSPQAIRAIPSRAVRLSSMQHLHSQLHTRPGAQRARVSRGRAQCGRCGVSALPPKDMLKYKQHVHDQNLCLAKTSAWYFCVADSLNILRQLQPQLCQRLRNAGLGKSVSMVMTAQGLQHAIEAL